MRLALLLIAPLVFGDSITDIIGPVTAAGTSPWPWYDKAEKGNVDDLFGLMLAHPPIAGAAAAGTFTLADACTITLTGAGASEFSNGDWAVVGWNATNGTGSGRMFFLISTATSTVLTSSNQCMLPVPANITGTTLTGLTVYHCAANCGQDTGTPPLFTPGNWKPFGNDYQWYDTPLAAYRYYLRTGDAAYHTIFTQITDLTWLWTYNQGVLNEGTTLGWSMTSQFVAALDGHPERFLPLYNMLKWNYDNHVSTINVANQQDPLHPVSFFDNRYFGLATLFLAVGARADPDATRKASYCTMLAQEVDDWYSTQTTIGTDYGYWMEKSANYPYRLPSVSPWRMYAPAQALARAYDVFALSTAGGGCQDATRANKALSAATRAANFMYDYGRANNRGVYYDVIGPNDGEIGSAGVVLGAGTVSVAVGSTAVTGVGTHFLTDFAGGTKYMGIEHSDGMAWTHRVSAVADDTHATIAEVWENPGGGAVGAQTNAVAETYYITTAQKTNCGSLAPTCYSLVDTNYMDGTLNGDRDSGRDLVWIMGWMYKTTGLAIYKTRGDEIFSASYGGPAGGPGFNYPGSAGPCGGPACDGVVTDYYLDIHGCTVSTTLPCADPGSARPDFYGNAFTFTGKRFGQGSGIGGADNYLSWRNVTPAGSQISGRVTISGTVTIH